MHGRKRLERSTKKDKAKRKEEGRNKRAMKDVRGEAVYENDERRIM